MKILKQAKDQRNNNSKSSMSTHQKYHAILGAWSELTENQH